MVATRRTPSRLQPAGLSEIISLQPKARSSKSVKSRADTARPNSLHIDVSEPEPSSELTSSDLQSVSWSSSPNQSPRHSRPLGAKRQTRTLSHQANGLDVEPFDMTFSTSPVASPPRKRFKAIENFPAKATISKSRSHPQSISKTLTSLCDQLAVQTPKPNTLPHKFASSGFSNVFSHARHLLKLSSTNQISSEAILGRAKEVSKIRRFFSDRYPTLFDSQELDDASSSAPMTRAGSLYISGPPGTGKTHLMNSVLLSQNHEIGRALHDAGIRVNCINCLALAGPSSASGGSSAGGNGLEEELWKKVGDCLGIARGGSKAGKASSTSGLVEKYIMNERCLPSIVILDEIDFLAASKQPLITSLLSLSQRSPNANFTVIGIANTLDLTTRFAASSGSQVEPDLIHFSSFGASDMIEIVRQRLKHLCPSYNYTPPNPVWGSSPAQKLFAPSTNAASTPMPKDTDSIPLFHPAALQLCAKKVSSVTGDLRTFLAILRKLIDSLELNVIRNNEFLEKSSGGQKSVLDTPTKMRKFTRIISSSQLTPDLGPRSSENEWPSSKGRDGCGHLTPSTAPKVSPSDVVKFLKTSGVLDQPSFNTSEAECSKKLQDLNLHQSLVLVCLCVGWSREQDEENGMGYGIGRSKAYEVYRDCLRPSDLYGQRNAFNIGIMPVSESEWTDLVESGLQTRGLVSFANHHPSGLGSCPMTPSTTTASKAASPLKSPSKRKPGGFQRSVLCTPTKPKQGAFGSPHSHGRPSPSRSNTNKDRTLDQIITPVHSISVLIQCIQCLAGRTEQATTDDKPRFSAEIISLLNQLLVAEERKMKKQKKRKAREMMDESDMIGKKNGFESQLHDDDEDDDERVLKERMVSRDDEGSCRD